MTDEWLRQLPWDSNWLGLSVAQFGMRYQASRVDVDTAIANCRATGVKLLYIILDPADAEASVAARTAGAWLADSRITYQVATHLPQLPSVLPVGIRFAPATVLTPELTRLVLLSGEYSRFRLDGRIGKEAFSILYSQWLEQAFNNGVIWVASTGSEVAGLLAFDVRDDQVSIELLAVAPLARRQRVGQALVQLAMHEAHQQGFTGLKVVTQGLNTPARNFYEQCGFQIMHTQDVYHLWL